MSCSHPLASLKAEEANQSSNGTLTVQFSCIGCLAHVTKVFTMQSPDVPVDHEVSALLEQAETCSTPAKVERPRRGANSPWRRYQGSPHAARR